MSKLKILKAAAALAIVFGPAILSGSCTETYIDNNCAEDADCHTAWNFNGWGSVCDRFGRCGCPNPSEKECCAGGGYICENAFWDCRSAAECDAKPTDCDASDACDGGPINPDAQVEPGVCTSDAECPGPPDPRCGSGSCVGGKCQLKIKAGEAVPSQRKGDCKAVVCQFDGTVKEVVETIDVPLDGNPCTFDICNAGVPDRPYFSDGVECPGVGMGICVLGKCKECDQKRGYINCPGELVCYFDRCVPEQCSDKLLNGQETYPDCGGPDCRPCEIGQPCVVWSDCLTGVCAGNECQPPTHIDGVKNDSETGVDCGYPEALPNSCPDGEGCIWGQDCQSEVCYAGLCQVPTCEDAVKNGGQTGIDCGGGDCSPCLN